MAVMGYRMDARDSSGLIRDAIRRDRTAELLHAPEVTPEGFRKMEAAVAQPMVLVYRKGDGSEVRELVPAEELHRDDSLDTLADKPLTLGHPDPRRYPRGVTKDNAHILSKGHVTGRRRKLDDGRAAFGIVATHADAIKAVDRKTHTQVSPGYLVDIDPTPGEHPEHGRYDAIQRNRRYNHLALVQRGRGGDNIHLRADDAVQVLPMERWTMNREETLKAIMELTGCSRADAEQRLDGGVPADIQAKLDTLPTETARADAAEAALKVHTDAQARADSDEGKAERKAQALDAFRERTSLLELGTTLKLDKMDKLDNEELAVAVVKAARQDVDPAKLESAAYVSATLDYLRADNAPSVSPYRKARTDSKGGGHRVKGDKPRLEKDQDAPSRGRRFDSRDAVTNLQRTA